MKKLAIVTSLLAMSSVSALAADLPIRTKAPPAPIVAVYDWSGFYIGANGGWGSSHDSRSNDTLASFLGSYDATGAVAGGQIGYRGQFGSWVVGLEAQGNWADLTGSTQNLFPRSTNSLHSKLDAFGLFTGQVGYAWDNLLLYAKGGAAVTNRNFEFVDNATGNILSSTGFNTRLGATAGAGLEFGFAPNWSVAVEYDHIFEDKHTVGFINNAGFFVNGNVYSTGGDTDLVTARINYRFGGPAPGRY